MILIISNDYPESATSYANAFIHKRVLLYKKEGYESLVVCLKHKNYEYNYDGISVVKGNEKFIRHRVGDCKISAIFIHFLTLESFHLVESLNICKNITRYVWIHGFEAEAWHRRYFIFSRQAKQFKNCIKKKEKFNDLQLKLLHDLFMNVNGNYKFIHVSKWFKDNVVECDVGVSTSHYTVIPNPIDTELFNYAEKPISQRLKFLVIRSFANSKYANDVSIDAINMLSQKPYFKQLEFLICGDGELFGPLTSKLRKYCNVTLKQGFLSQKEISSIHKEYGVFLCPTRWDSQGVSMCEAMSSGMVVISTNCSAIPEFVSHRVSGFLGDNKPETLISFIEELIENPSLFTHVSRNASAMISDICGHKTVTLRELSLINEVPVQGGVNEFGEAYWKTRYKELEESFESTMKNLVKDEFIVELVKETIKQKIENASTFFVNIIKRLLESVKKSV